MATHCAPGVCPALLQDDFRSRHEMLLEGRPLAVVAAGGGALVAPQQARRTHALLLLPRACQHAMQCTHCYPACNAALTGGRLAPDVQAEAPPVWPPPEAVLPAPLPQLEPQPEQEPQAPPQPAEPEAHVPEQPHNAAVLETAGAASQQQHQHQMEEQQQRAGTLEAAGTRADVQAVEARQQQQAGLAAPPAAQGQHQAEQQPVRRRGLLARLLRRRRRGAG